MADCYLKILFIMLYKNAIKCILYLGYRLQFDFFAFVEYAKMYIYSEREWYQSVKYSGCYNICFLQILVLISQYSISRESFSRTPHASHIFISIPET